MILPETGRIMLLEVNLNASYFYAGLGGLFISIDFFDSTSHVKSTQPEKVERIEWVTTIKLRVASLA